MFIFVFILCQYGASPTFSFVDIYYIVFRRINKQLPSLTKLELSQCSPRLSNARGLELGVPGTYRVDGSYIKIDSLSSSIDVITSKQRPRKVTIRGSDGKSYLFLLKGHEDIRQDERVMQLFGLVNALLVRDPRTKKHDLRIQRYAISALSHNCGLVGWVPQTDTLHSLIRDYRHGKKIPLNMENKEMLQLAQDYDQLTVMQKVEVFTEALKRTVGQGNDLYEILWLKSLNSEEWLDRRTKFTRSQAVMCMVGYILGLGDRHPSNLMLDKVSGRILHIDFGDCFEVAMNRDKYPEKVPFRLTRMLIRAMEVSGIEGSYRSTCERTMSVLRGSRDSLVTMLEAFVYDPLISWRLANLSAGSNEDAAEPPVATTSEASPDGMIIDDLGILGSTLRNSGVSVDPILEVSEEEDSVTDFSEDDMLLHDEGPTNGKKPQHQIVAMSAATTGGHTRGHFRRNQNSAMTSTSVNVHSNDDLNNSNSSLNIATSRARSLQIFSDIQHFAAQLTTDSRIASITAESVKDKGRSGRNNHHSSSSSIAASHSNNNNNPEGSLARSRMELSLRQREVMLSSLLRSGGNEEAALNEKALKVIRRVQDKLTGTDFPDSSNAQLDVSDQVQRLIVQATSSENLCQLFIGWCSFW